MKMLSLVLLEVSFLLSGCLTSPNPFYAEADITQDDRLLGDYRDPESQEGFLIKDDQDRRGRYLVQCVEGASGSHSITFTGTLFNLGGRTFLDLLPISDSSFNHIGGTPPGPVEIMHGLTFQPLHLVARVDLTENGVGFSVPKRQELGVLIQRDPSLRQFIRVDTLLLPMQTPELRKLLERHGAGDGVFPKPAKFQKPKTAEGQPPNDLDKLVAGLLSYRATYREFPKGNGPAIFKALVAVNTRHEIFIQWNPAFIAKDGSFLDRWGSPYNVSFPDAESVEVRSAGPDKVLNTKDDQYIRKGTRGTESHL